MFYKLNTGLPDHVDSSESDWSIRVHRLGKNYQIYDAPRDRLKQFIMPSLTSLLGGVSRQYFREYPALRDISFDVKKGETVGIIGRNGAGKSTLLQIICGTLTPSSGSVETKGRVAALLELGSGFNAEFTGRENVYMNAGVLGLSREEIDARFDEIIAFADIGDFIDQPVKTYSSGMHVRLAFSVIVHVNADILIVDEALAVGDMYFQAKCMVHMKKLIASGVTILFVSHDTNAVKALCSRCVYLEGGTVSAYGPTNGVLEVYYGAAVKSRQQVGINNSPPMGEVSQNLDQKRSNKVKEIAFTQRAAFHRIQNGMAEFLNVELLDESGKDVEAVEFGQKLVLRMTIQNNLDLICLAAGYHIKDRNGFDVIYSDTGLENCHLTNLISGEVVVMDWEFHINLRADEYTIGVGLSIPLDLSISKVEVCDWVPLAANISVGRGVSLPIHAAVYWPNAVSAYR